MLNSVIPRSALLLFLITSALLSCVKSQPVRESPMPGSGKAPSINGLELEIKIHDLINKERRKQGLSLLAWDDALSNIARKHSRDMAKRNYFSHDTPEGHDFSYRYSEAGYSCSIRGQGHISYGGAENIFQNNLYDRVTIVNGIPYYDWNSEDTIAESTVRGWMNSRGHRKNILAPYWRTEGIGVAILPDGKVYITQNFC